MQTGLQPRSAGFTKASSRQTQRSSRNQVQALWSRKTSAPVVEKPPSAPAKKQLLSWPAAKPAQSPKPAAKPASKPAPSKPAAKVVDKAATYKKQQSFLSALDFSDVRSKSDAELLYDARYGKRGEDGKMSREQYQALRRKIGGTAKDFWKTSIDVKGEYTDKGWVSKSDSVTASSVPGLPFLVVTCLAMFGTLAFVVSQTS